MTDKMDADDILKQYQSNGGYLPMPPEPDQSLASPPGSLAGSDYRHLQTEKPWIAAKVKKLCPAWLSFNILEALEIQDKEIERLNKIIKENIEPSRSRGSDS